MSTEYTRWEAGAVAWCVIALTPACETFHYCEAPARDRIESAPDALSETGLFTDVARRTLAAGVLTFRPEFELWSDGASKQRWVYVPPGETIDTRDMDNWRFPSGTKLWKEFRDGDMPVETRLLQKLGPGDAEWLTMSYLWKEDEVTRSRCRKVRSTHVARRSTCRPPVSAPPAMVVATRSFGVSRRCNFRALAVLRDILSAPVSGLLTNAG